MANWSNPTLTSLYTDFVTEVKNRDVDLALGLDPATTSPTNVPTNAIRWNSASFKYQKWDGSTWNDLSAKYIFTAVEVSGATVPVNGMYLSTTNTLNFSTASTASRLTIDGSGNVNIDSGTFYVDAVNNRVGVGETSAQARLHVAANIADSTAITWANSQFSVATPIAGNSTANRATIYFAPYGSDNNYAPSAISCTAGTSGASSLRFFTNVSGNLTGDITSYERLRIDASGNLGLGGTAVDYSGYKNIRINGTDGGILDLSTNGTSVFRITGGTSGVFYYTQNAAYPHVWGAGASERMRLDASGNLGLGVTPSAWSGNVKGFDISSGGAIYAGSVNIGLAANFYLNSSGQYIYKTSTYAAGYIPNYANNGSHAWLTAPSGTAGAAISFTQAMTLDASGNLGLGTTSLDLVGSTTSLTLDRASGNGQLSLAANGTVRGRIFADNGSSELRIGNPTANPVTFFTANTERARIDSSGYMQGTVNGLGAGRIPAKQYYRLDSAFTGTNGTAAQPIYGVGVTLIGSTVYEFEAIYAFSRSTGSTSHTMSFLFGGTATINNIFYTGVGPGEGVLPPLSTYDGAPASFVATSAGASVATAAMTIGTGIFYIVKGTVSINAGGTFIPQYQLSAAPGGAYSTYAGAYFSIWPLAASGSAVNIGSWA